MRELPLDSEYVTRLRHYRDFAAAEATQSAAAKSDYWKLQAALARIEFLDASVRVEGQSGFYVPPEATNLKFALAERVWRTYKRGVSALDARLRLSSPHSPGTYLIPSMAYDLIFGRGRGFEVGCYADNPYHFDLSSIHPRFRSSADLRRNWFLKDRFIADGDVVHAAFYHALIEHFLADAGRPISYLEIGAGNGNLTSFFHHYNSAHVTIVDLPETILFSASYLKSAFPGASVLLPNEIESSFTAEILARYDFIFLLPSQIETLPAGVFDVMVNLFSMQEMTRAQIVQYFALVGRVGSGGALWCNVNRVEKFCTADEPPTRAYEFPYDARSRVLVHQVDEYLELVQPEPHVIRIERLP